MDRENRYQSKIERFTEEEEFISAHVIENDVTERALLYSLQVAIEISMDLIAMKVRDMGLKVEDDATNIEKITDKNIISKGEGDFLRQMNGVRNFIVHRYNHLDMGFINEALSRIDKLKNIIIKVADY
ncbi:hypothetical protein ig2599ANME_1619 [groundwater metagenome]